MHLEPRILVTGGSGFLGSHVCERILSSGADVIRIVPVPVEIGAAGAIGWILCCQIFSANGLVAEQRLLMAKQRGPQNRELLVGL
jgi:uncharacterized protein YbjT (DUF2867 family)